MSDQNAADVSRSLGVQKWLAAADKAKTIGNDLYTQGDWPGAINLYSRAIAVLAELSRAGGAGAVGGVGVGGGGEGGEHVLQEELW